MKISGKSGLYVSIIAILVYWSYEVYTARDSAQIPDSFSEFAVRILLIKLAHLAAIFQLLRVEGASWRELGISGVKWKKQILTGMLFGLLLFLLLNVGLSNVLSSVFPNPGGSDNLSGLFFDDPRNLFVWLLIGILGGGVVEELSRVFVLTRFEKAFQQPGLYIALICSSVIFGIGHLYQGNSVAFSTGISGLAMGIIYIRRRSALEVITAHAFSDVLAILAAFQLASHN